MSNTLLADGSRARGNLAAPKRNAPSRRVLAGMTQRLSLTLGSPVVGHKAALRELWQLA